MGMIQDTKTMKLCRADRYGSHIGWMYTITGKPSAGLKRTFKHLHVKQMRAAGRKEIEQADIELRGVDRCPIVCEFDDYVYADACADADYYEADYYDDMFDRQEDDDYMSYMDMIEARELYPI